MKNFSVRYCSSDGFVTVFSSDLTLESAYRIMVRLVNVLPAGTSVYILRDDTVRVFEYEIERRGLN